MFNTTKSKASLSAVSTIAAIQAAGRPLTASAGPQHTGVAANLYISTSPTASGSYYRTPLAINRAYVPSSFGDKDKGTDTIGPCSVATSTPDVVAMHNFASAVVASNSFSPGSRNMPPVHMYEIISHETMVERVNDEDSEYLLLSWNVTENTVYQSDRYFCVNEKQTAAQIQQNAPIRVLIFPDPKLTISISLPNSSNSVAHITAPFQPTATPYVSLDVLEFCKNANGKTVPNKLHPNQVYEQVSRNTGRFAMSSVQTYVYLRMSGTTVSQVSIRHRGNIDHMGFSIITLPGNGLITVMDDEETDILRTMETLKVTHEEAIEIIRDARARASGNRPLLLTQPVEALTDETQDPEETRFTGYAGFKTNTVISK